MDLKKDLAIVGGLFLVVAVLIVFGRGFTTIGRLPGDTQSTPSAQTLVEDRLEKGKTGVRIKSLNVVAEVAATDKEKSKGLAKRESLPFSEGMLFVYDKSAIYTFWMKDMEFPIDIIWIDSSKRIVDMALSAQPEPDTDDEDLKRYRPSGEAQYILEVNAGLATANGLVIGNQVDFEL